MNSTDKRMNANKVLLRNDFSNDQKLFIISQLYKEELSNQFPQLYYALLGWKDLHLKELWSKEVTDYLENIKMDGGN